MPTAHITLDPRFQIGAIDRRLFGSFVEHMGRGVYGGIYEPGHPTADDEGFRRDVIELVRELGVTGIRYPGGNFVSGYRWEDGVGPRDQRPKRLDLAWHSMETNEVGLHEFASWVEKVGGELMLALNLGSRGPTEAVELLEYANVAGGSTLAERRIANGRTDPFGIRTWYLGNEMDGPWQLGHRPAAGYGEVASRTAKAMRQLDPHVELVLCGSSHMRMPTFGEWERLVLSHAYDDVDYISCHAYYEEKDGDLGSFLASAAHMDRFIDAVAATADHVKAVRRSRKTMKISFDEWNVWYLEPGLRTVGGQTDRYYRTDEIAGSDWPVAPRLAEDTYSVADGVVVGNLLISLLRHADRVTSANLSMLVNTIAPIRTEPGGPAWRQATFFPFALTSKLATGTALRLAVDTLDHETAAYGRVPTVDAAATHDAEAGRTCLFLVNRLQDEATTVTVDVRALAPVREATARTLADPDVHAHNSAEQPDRVGLVANDTVTVGDGTVSVTLPPVSWTALTLT